MAFLPWHDWLVKSSSNHMKPRNFAWSWERKSSFIGQLDAEVRLVLQQSFSYHKGPISTTVLWSSGALIQKFSHMHLNVNYQPENGAIQTEKSQVEPDQTMPGVCSISKLLVTRPNKFPRLFMEALNGFPDTCILIYQVSCRKSFLNLAISDTW